MTQLTGAAELPEALRLADAIDPFVRKERPDHLTSKVAADEMRRLHAENARLSELCDKWNIECDEFREDNKRLSAQVEALRARGAVPPCQWAHKGCDTPNYCESVQRCTARDSGRAQPAGAATPAAQEPVAIVKWRIGGKVVHLVGDVEIGALLYTHPSPPEGMMGGWISVKERLPEHRQSVAFIVDSENWETFKYLHGRVLGGSYLSKQGFSVPGLSLMASHWMPLPPPPTTSAGSGKGE